jgi:hypothetical protein
MAFSESSGQPSGKPPTNGTASEFDPGPAPRPEVDWTDQVTDLVVDTVDKVRSRTPGPVLGIARGSVYGIVALIVAVPIVIAFFAGLIRGLDWLIPGPIWIVYLIVAALLWLAGWILWLRREKSTADQNPAPS